MRRNAAAVLMVAAFGGCMSFQSGPETGGGGNSPHWGKSYGPPTVPGVKGPYGENVPMAAPYTSAPPPNPYIAQQMMSRSVPLSAVQMSNPAACGPYGCQAPPGAMVPPTPIPPGGFLSPPGVPFAPGVSAGPNVPGGPGMMPGGMPSARMGPGMPSGMVPAGGVRPANMPMAGGVINANIPPGMMPPGGIMQTQMAQANPAAGIRFQGQRTQIRFVRPSGMKISWFTQGPDGRPMFSTTPIEAPGRYNFPQAAIYRLKLSNIEGRPGLEIYPTMEVVPGNPKTEAFLAHSAVPIEFTNEDFKQIAEGNYVVKVIYLPDPQFQDVAGTGTDEILSTRLEPGADPIQEALRRGSILIVLRMGNVDQEAPNTPPLNAPGPNAAPPMMAPPGPGLAPPPGFQVPFWGMKPGMPMMGPGGPIGPVGPGGPMMPPIPGGSAPIPGPLNVPSVELPGTGTPAPSVSAPPPPISAAPKPLPGPSEVSGPKGAPTAVPGTSSTNKFQDNPAAPRALPQNTGPAFPTTPGSVDLPAGSNGPNLPAESNPPSIPASPMSRAPVSTPTTAQLAGQAEQK